MLFSLLALVAALQTQAPAPQVVRVALTPPPAETPAPPPAAPAAQPEPEPAVETVPEAPRTRQVCRYVEVTGQRFAQRRCRTVPID